MYNNKNKIIYQDDLIVKFLIESKKNGNNEVIIDIDDWKKIKDYKWCIRKDNGNHLYVITSTNKYKYRLQRFILNLTNSEFVVHHISHNTLDNRKQNLRICSNAENIRNQKLNKKNTSGYKGVYWDKSSNKWHCHIKFNKKTIYLGLFTNIKDAAKAYNEAALKYHGEFAYLNKIEGERQC